MPYFGVHQHNLKYTIKTLMLFKNLLILTNFLLFTVKNIKETYNKWNDLLTGWKKCMCFHLLLQDFNLYICTYTHTHFTDQGEEQLPVLPYLISVNSIFQLLVNQNFVRYVIDSTLFSGLILSFLYFLSIVHEKLTLSSGCSRF
jgi:hypothetical protein